MEFDLTSEGDVLLVTTRGRISDISPGDDDPLAQNAGPQVYSRKVLVDLSDSEFINTGGISWLLKCHKLAREAKGMVVLHSIPPLVRQTLQILQLDRVFTLAKDLPTARRIAAGGPPANDEPAVGELS